MSPDLINSLLIGGISILFAAYDRNKQATTPLIAERPQIVKNSLSHKSLSDIAGRSCSFRSENVKAVDLKPDEYSSNKYNYDILNFIYSFLYHRYVLYRSNRDIAGSGQITLEVTTLSKELPTGDYVGYGFSEGNPIKLVSLSTETREGTISGILEIDVSSMDPETLRYIPNHIRDSSAVFADEETVAATLLNPRAENHRILRSALNEVSEPTDPSSNRIFFNN